MKKTNLLTLLGGLVFLAVVAASLIINFSGAEAPEALYLGSIGGFFLLAAGSAPKIKKEATK